MIKKRLAKKALSAQYYDVWVNVDPNVEPLTLPRNGRCLSIVLRACRRFHCEEFIKDIEEQLEKLDKWLEEDDTK